MTSLLRQVRVIDLPCGCRAERPMRLYREWERPWTITSAEMSWGGACEYGHLVGDKIYEKRAVVKVG